MISNLIQSGTLIEAYPRHPFAGYIVRCALYINHEVKLVPKHPGSVDDGDDITASGIEGENFRYIAYHRIMTPGGMLDLPEDIYIVNPLTDTLKLPVS